MPIFGSHRHVALIYDDDAERGAATTRFIKQGLERGYLCLYVGEESTYAAFLAAIAWAGVDVRAAIVDGRLVLATTATAFLSGGGFDPHAMIAMLQGTVARARENGLEGLFVAGEMSWVLGGKPGTNRLTEYESLCAAFFPANPAVSLCEYNRWALDRDALRRVLLTHPWVMIGGRLCHNFYHVALGENLTENLELPQDVDKVLEDLVVHDAAERMVVGTTLAIEGGGADQFELQDASLLTKIYSELVPFKTHVLSLAENRVSGKPRSRTRAVDQAEILQLRGELQAIQQRLDFWQDKVRRLAGLDYDQDARRVRFGHRSVRLSKRESQLIAALLSQNGRPLGTRELRWRAWGGNNLAEAQVRTYVSQLRKKLAALELPASLDNEPGLGYALRFDSTGAQPPQGDSAS